MNFICSTQSACLAILCGLEWANAGMQTLLYQQIGAACAKIKAKHLTQIITKHASLVCSTCLQRNRGHQKKYERGYKKILHLSKM